MAFDLKTQRLNKKGQVTHRQPYRLYVKNGVQMFERPPGSGNFFNPDGTPILKKEDKKAKAQKVVVKEELPEVQAEVEVSEDMADLKSDLLGEESEG